MLSRLHTLTILLVFASLVTTAVSAGAAVIPPDSTWLMNPASSPFDTVWVKIKGSDGSIWDLHAARGEWSHKEGDPTIAIDSIWIITKMGSQADTCHIGFPSPLTHSIALDLGTCAEIPLTLAMSHDVAALVYIKDNTISMPGVSEWSLIFLAVALGGAGFWMVRRRRRAQV